MCGLSMPAASQRHIQRHLRRCQRGPPFQCALAGLQRTALGVQHFTQVRLTQLVAALCQPMRPLTVLAGAAERYVPALLTGHPRQAPFDFLQRAGQRLLEGDVSRLALGIGQVDGGAAAWIVQ